jgi:hypothetical protein
MSRQNKAWGWEIELKETKKKIKSWFYSDNYDDAKNRLESYMNSTVISLEEIENPLKNLNYGKSNTIKT